MKKEKKIGKKLIGYLFMSAPFLVLFYFLLEVCYRIFGGWGIFAVFFPFISIALFFIGLYLIKT
jgi:hypothetical protein